MTENNKVMSLYHNAIMSNNYLPVVVHLPNFLVVEQLSRFYTKYKYYFLRFDWLLLLFFIETYIHIWITSIDFNIIMSMTIFFWVLCMYFKCSWKWRPIHLRLNLLEGDLTKSCDAVCGNFLETEALGFFLISIYRFWDFIIKVYTRNMATNKGVGTYS